MDGWIGRVIPLLGQVNIQVKRSNSAVDLHVEFKVSEDALVGVVELLQEICDVLGQEDDFELRPHLGRKMLLILINFCL